MKWVRRNTKEIFDSATPVFVATLLPLIFSLSPSFWCALTTFTIIYACRDKPLRHGFIAFMSVLCGVFLGFAITWLPILITNLLTFFALLIAAFIYRLKPGLYLNIRLNSIIFASVLFWYASVNIVKDYVVLRTVIANIFIGGGIAFVSFLVFLRYPLYRMLQRNLIPILKGLHRFAGEKNFAEEKNKDNRIDLQLMIVNPKYPNWVFEPGLNPGLRGGFRYFLIHLEMLIDFYVALANVEPLIKRYLSEDLLQVKNNNTQLLEVLLNYFEKDRKPSIPTDLTTDIAAMEKTTQSILPPSTQMLDLAPDYIPLQSWVRLNKDIRQQLLFLLDALP